MFKLIFLATIVAVASGNKKCPWVMGKSPFDETKIAGEWYLINAIMDKSITCGKYDYQVKNDAHIIQFSGKSDNGTPFMAESFGQPSYGKSNKGANMLTVWKKGDGNYSDIVMQSTVMTDYENYAVFIACRNAFDDTNKTFNRKLIAGILSRKPTLPVETVQVLQNVISGYDIDVSAMKPIEHNNC